MNLARLTKSPYAQIAIIGAIVILLLGVWLLVASDTDQQDQSSQTSDKSTDISNGSAESMSLPKPTLSKSSGNAGPISAGALVNFICSNVVNVDCQIILENQDSSDEVLLLDKQFINPPDRGQPSVLWTWKSVKGRWNVSAIVSADGYSDNQSNPQELVVE